MISVTKARSAIRGEWTAFDEKARLWLASGFVTDMAGGHMVWVAGVDGCRAGWLAAFVCFEAERAVAWDARILANVAQVLEDPREPKFVAVDIPIGLLSEHVAGGRECDRGTRKAIGARRSSVFPPPVRSLLGATHFDEVRGKGLSIQGFGLLPKIAEVDAWITPELQERVFESHPEMAFTRLLGSPMQHYKLKAPGKQERREALVAVYPGFEDWLAYWRVPRSQAGLDDLLDAMVLSWTAWRRFKGIAVSIPERPPRDERGLEMAIWS
ncbi:DUF429 domain-containing protein [Sulfidibacter corallicola]|uniref:DUF429 domain-containing protein n=1 Tax=Sulfidibacter corallicola TaxID=2818388 RepID=A0A8A4TVT7_SULCO|nr:DUF429 domain-containing protein [Sulfidibacter corallicola]QTD53092.1 DUF429 domain-containing protein [Sulfidibacter corallicola]